MNPMDVLAPNNITYMFANSGIEGLTTNMGYGVAEVMPQHEEEIEESKQRSKRSTARQFGKPMTQVTR